MSRARRRGVQVAVIVGLGLLGGLRSSVHEARVRSASEELARYDAAQHALRAPANPPAATSAASRVAVPASRRSAGPRRRRRTIEARIRRDREVSPVVPAPSTEREATVDPPEFHAFDERAASIELLGHLCTRGGSVVCATIVDDARIEVHEKIWIREGERAGAHQCVSITERNGRVRAIFHDVARASVCRAELEIDR